MIGNVNNLFPYVAVVTITSAKTLTRPISSYLETFLSRYILQCCNAVTA